MQREGTPMSVTADLGGTSLEVGLVMRAQAGDLEDAFGAMRRGEHTRQVIDFD